MVGNLCGKVGGQDCDKGGGVRDIEVDFALGQTDMWTLVILESILTLKIQYQSKVD